jgi:hypothetical protein
MSVNSEYLLSYGKAGDFGRFRADEPLPCSRGSQVVVRSHRGQELAVVMRPANEQHASFLADKFVGQILRLASDGDRELAERMQRKSQALFEDTRRMAADLGLPLEILDAEILLDGRQAVLHHLRWADCDPRHLMDQVAERYHLLVSLHDLGLKPAGADKDEQETGGCGLPGCHSGEGGCGSCSSDGGCGTCSNHKSAPDSPRDPRPMIPVASC